MTDLNTASFAVFESYRLWPQSDKAQAELFFSDPRINLFVPSSVTRDYYPKILERLHLLHVLGLLIAGFHSRLVARN